MIRKPAETEFRDTALVNAIRGSRKITAEGGKGISKGIARIYLLFLASTFGFGLLMTLVTRLGYHGWLGILAVVVLITTFYQHVQRGKSASPGRAAQGQTNTQRPERNVHPLGAAVAAVAPSSEQSLDALRQVRPFGRRPNVKQ